MAPMDAEREVDVSDTVTDRRKRALDRRKSKLAERHERVKAAQRRRAEKIAPAITPTEFQEKGDDLSAANVADMSGSGLSWSPWIGMCSIPLNFSYGPNLWNRWHPWHEDYEEPCCCAPLGEIEGFDSYYKGTFAQLLLEAKRLHERIKLPVLIERPDLDRYPWPKDIILAESRSEANRVPLRNHMDAFWAVACQWLRVPPYVWVLDCSSVHIDGVDEDATYGFGTHMYLPLHEAQSISWKKMEELSPSRENVLLSGEKVPFPRPGGGHDFWVERIRASVEREHKERR